MPSVDIEDNVEQKRWDYTNKYNKWEGGGFRVDEEHNQNRMLAKESCIDKIRNMKWQIYFSHLTERANWTIHLMMQKRKVVKERIRVTKMTNLKLT
jgi:hypothetical protein